MKPVCDHPSYCRNDAGTLYLGQSGNLGASDPSAACWLPSFLPFATVMRWPVDLTDFVCRSLSSTPKSSPVRSKWAVVYS